MKRLSENILMILYINIYLIAVISGQFPSIHDTVDFK